MAGQSYNPNPNKRPRMRSLLPAVIAWRDRMINVVVENVDAFTLLDRYDRPDVFAFCDPPYHLATCKSGLYRHYKFDHHRLVRRLQQFQGKVLLCGYEHRLYDLQLLGWRRKAFRVSKSLGGRAPRTEVVWLNYDENGERISQDLKLIREFEGLPT